MDCPEAGRDGMREDTVCGTVVAAQLSSPKQMRLHFSASGKLERNFFFFFFS